MLRNVEVVIVAEQSQVIEIASIAKILCEEHTQALLHLLWMLIGLRDYALRIKLIQFCHLLNRQELSLS